MCMCKDMDHMLIIVFLLATDSNSTVLHFDSLNKLDAQTEVSQCQCQLVK